MVVSYMPMLYYSWYGLPFVTDKTELTKRGDGSTLYACRKDGGA